MKNHRLEILLFLVVWLGYGLTINSRNLESFSLQQAGVEAIVERGVFYVEGSRSERLQPRGDVFAYDGHKYAAKQPGQFMLGALCYFFLHLVGLDYVDNYLATSALVTFFTASLVAAASALLVYRLALALTREGGSRLWALAAALCYAFATTMFAYAGVAHHDAIATAFVTAALYCSFQLSRTSEKSGRRALLSSLAAGFCLGLTVTTSMLVFWPALAVALYFVSLRRWRALPYFLAGGILGLLPLFFYNAVNFGNPFLLPNVAGNYSDTFFHPGLDNLRSKLGFYARFLMLYTPTLLVGLAGLSLWPRSFRREKLVCWGAVLLLCAYVFNIETVGTCQYGPRYLLPATAFACLGLTGFSHLEAVGARRVWLALIALSALFGFFVNAVGAVGGAMYCDLARYALPSYLANIRQGNTGTFPLFKWLFIPTVMCVYWLAWLVMTSEARPKALSTTARRSKMRG